MSSPRPEIGDVVRYGDEEGRTHFALVTSVHGFRDEGGSLNVAYVNPGQSDEYGCVVERATSVPWLENKPPEHQNAFYVVFPA